MIRYVVANRDWTGDIIEVIPVLEFFDCKGRHTDNLEEAFSCVAGNHAFDLDLVPIFPVH